LKKVFVPLCFRPLRFQSERFKPEKLPFHFKEKKSRGNSKEIGWQFFRFGFLLRKKAEVSRLKLKGKRACPNPPVRARLA